MIKKKQQDIYIYYFHGYIYILLSCILPMSEPRSTMLSPSEIRDSLWELSWAGKELMKETEMEPNRWNWEVRGTNQEMIKKWEGIWEGIGKHWKELVEAARMKYVKETWMEFIYEEAK